MHCKVIKQYFLNQSPLYCLRSKKKLANILFVSFDKLIALTSTNELYLERERFDKKKKKNLHIKEPKPALKRIHKRIKILLERIKIPNFIYSPKKGCSCVNNAKLHIDNNVLRKLDIRSYFSSISSRRVYWFFNKRMKCSKDVAGILTKLLTFKGCLPTGSPSSPIISYYAHIDMWESISKIAMEANCSLSVWLDDITVSGKTVPTQVIWRIKKAIKRSGLSYHKEKYYAGKKPREVTGSVIVNGRLLAPKRQHLKRKHLLLRIDRQQNLNSEALTLKLSLNGLEAHIQQIESHNR